MIKIQPYNFSRNNFNTRKNFKGAAGSSISGGQLPQEPQQRPKRSSMANLIYFGVLANTLIASPLLHNMAEESLEKEYEQYQTDDKTRLLYDEINNKAKIDEKTSGAFYNLKQFQNIEMPKIKRLEKDLYQADFDINNQKISLTMNTKELEKEILSGVMTVQTQGKEKETFDYKADFSGDNIREFNIELISKKDSTATKKTLIRDTYGELSVFDKDKNTKTLINKESLDRHDEKQHLSQMLIDSENAFRTSQKFNYIICILFSLIMMTKEPPQKTNQE